MSNKFARQILVLIISMIMFLHNDLKAQSKGLAFGLEQDVLPYVTGGYYAAAWVGKQHVRARALVAHVNKPSFILLMALPIT